MQKWPTYKFLDVSCSSEKLWVKIFSEAEMLKPKLSFTFEFSRTKVVSSNKQNVKKNIFCSTKKFRVKVTLPPS